MVINTNANLNFSNNSALYGGDICMDNSTVHVVTDGIHFYNNRGLQGGAIHIGYSTLYINSNKSVNFIMNIGQIQGGAIYIAACIPSSSCIILDKFAEILLYNNSSFWGGALYTEEPSYAIKVGYHSSVQFINNTAADVGGAVYVETQSAAPCLFMVTDYSVEIAFIGNHANHFVGHHIYGANLRDYRCNKGHNYRND